ncbi:uncharacterized protein [Miscanthus floridulus]|uniref:uncharacterized protein n=1 Tax=Miscanthus floridulus TaxID=154761 RepID=UPI0034598909
MASAPVVVAPAVVAGGDPLVAVPSVSGYEAGGEVRGGTSALDPTGMGSEAAAAAAPGVGSGAAVEGVHGSTPASYPALAGSEAAVAAAPGGGGTAGIEGAHVGAPEPGPTGVASVAAAAAAPCDEGGAGGYGRGHWSASGVGMIGEGEGEGEEGAGWRRRRCGCRQRRGTTLTTTEYLSVSGILGFPRRANRSAATERPRKNKKKEKKPTRAWIRAALNLDPAAAVDPPSSIGFAAAPTHRTAGGRGRAGVGATPTRSMPPSIGWEGDDAPPWIRAVAAGWGRPSVDPCRRGGLTPPRRGSAPDGPRRCLPPCAEEHPSLLLATVIGDLQGCECERDKIHH